ncbi:hypothetical protein K8Z49_37895 [Actinomadura madurae]|uniref:hypothetical protein n=1 Tax=Actinomadura madurae TaxID=1993 RepID=UPI00399B7586
MITPSPTTVSAPVYAAPRRPLLAGPVKRCPVCCVPLDGGPVRFRCEPCGQPVMAADLDTEFRAASDRPGVDSDPVRTVRVGRHPA